MQFIVTYYHDCDQCQANRAERTDEGGESGLAERRAGELGWTCVSHQVLAELITKLLQHYLNFPLLVLGEVQILGTG